MKMFKANRYRALIDFTVKSVVSITLVLLMTVIVLGASPTEKRLAKAAKKYNKGKHTELNVFIEALFDEDIETRKLALRYLNEFKDIESLNALHQILITEDEEIFQSAFDIVLEFRNPSSVPIFIDLLGNQSEERDSIIIDELSKFGPKALTEINDSYLNGDSTLKEKLGKVLIKLQPESIIYLYYDLLNQKIEESEHTRFLCNEIGDEMYKYILTQYAKRSLEDLDYKDSPEGIQLLKQMTALGKPFVEYLLNEIADVSESFTGSYIAKENFRESMKSVIINQEVIPLVPIQSHLFNQDVETQKFAVEILIKLGGISNEMLLLELLKNPNTQKLTRFHILNLLSEFREVSPISTLFPLILDSNVDIANMAKKALLNVGGKFSEDVELFLCHEEEKVQSLALEIAYCYPSPIYLEKLEYCANSESEIIRIRTAECLSKIDDERAVDVLFRLFMDESRITAWAAATGLAMKNGRARMLLEQYLLDKPGELNRRIMAIYTLGEIGDGSCINTLILCASESNFEKQAVFTVVDNFGEDVIPGLLEYLAVPDTSIQLITIQICRRLQLEGLSTGIYQLLRSPSYLIRLNAINILANVNDESVIDSLIQYVDRQDPLEMLAVIEAIRKKASQKGLIFLLETIKNNRKFYIPHTLNTISIISEGEMDRQKKADILFQTGKTLLYKDEWDLARTYISKANEIHPNQEYQQYLNQIERINQELSYITKLYDDGYIDNRVFWNYARMYYEYHPDEEFESKQFKIKVCNSIINDLLVNCFNIEGQNLDTLYRIDELEFSLINTELKFMGTIPDSSQDLTFNQLNLVISIRNNSENSVLVTPLIFKLIDFEGRVYFPRIKYIHQDLATKEVRFIATPIEPKATNEIDLTFVIPVTFSKSEYELQVMGTNPWQPRVLPLPVRISEHPKIIPGYKKH